MIRPAVVVAMIVVATCAGCGKRDRAAEEQPAPSASVITLGAAVGTCEDVAVCARECDAGSADRCRRLAATYAFGEGAARDEARATGLYEQACAMKDAPSCIFAGQMYEYAHGVAKDDEKAARFYRKACDMPSAAGCYNLAIMYENGRGVAKDPARAAELYQVACTAGSRTACDKAKRLRD
ncbi:MAG: tetratricopeptide repeat protein [Polyangiaceae bacterium]